MGWSELGQMFSGGKERQQDAYSDELGRLAVAEKKMNDARRSRLETSSLEKITAQSMLSAGVVGTLEEGELLSNIAVSGLNANTITSAMANLSEQRIQRQRQEAISANDTKKYNQLTALEEGKPYSEIDVKGGYAFDPSASLENVQFKATPLTAAKEAGAAQTIAASKSRTADSRARTQSQISNASQRTAIAKTKASNGPSKKSAPTKSVPDKTGSKVFKFNPKTGKVE
jgi:hypothetical protein